MATGPKASKSDQKRQTDFKAKATSVLNQLDLPISLYAATSKDRYRKPAVGMWEELKKDYGLEATDSVDLSNSIFVGDAGGRTGGSNEKLRKDFSCSDRFATAIQSPSYCNLELAVVQRLTFSKELCRECWNHVPYSRGIFPKRGCKAIYARF